MMSRAGLPRNPPTPPTGKVSALAARSSAAAAAGAVTKPYTGSNVGQTPYTAWPGKKAVTRTLPKANHIHGRSVVKLEANDDAGPKVVGNSSPLVRLKRSSAWTATNAPPTKRVKVENAQDEDDGRLLRPRLSEHLTATATVLPAEEFHQLAAAYLFPLLDDLPLAQSRVIQDAFDAAAKKERELLELLRFDKQEKIISEGVQDMLRLIRRDPYHADIESHMLGVVNNAVAWLSSLFIVGVEHRKHLNEVLQAFKLAFTAIEQVYGDEAGYAFSTLR